MKPNELVLRFFSSLGRPAETNYYVSLFRDERPERFAIICVSDLAMRQAAGALVVDLRMLAQLDLRPVLTFGQVSPASAAKHAARIREQLGTVRSEIVSPDKALAVTNAGGIALVPAPTSDDVDARFDAVATLAADLGTRKVVLLGRRSGIQPIGREVLSLIDLTTEYDALVEPGVLPEKQAAQLRQIRRVVDQVPHRITAAVTSPLDLLRELFTVRGAGTLIRRGAEITRYTDYARLALARLAELFASAFDKPLVDGFFDRRVASVLVANDYRGAAIVTDTALGPYLTKFAVDQAARGEGVGRDLWRALDQEYPTLFWRSRPTNPIAPWYTHNCDGMMKDEDWHVFWRGLEPRDIAPAVQYARRAPIDFE